MATLAAIQKQIASLQKQAETIRNAETASAAGKVKELIERYNLTAADVGLTSKGGRPTKAADAKGANAGRKNAGPKKAGVPKYRDPATGKTWTGHGKPPGWIVGAKSREPFLIDGKGNGNSAGDAAAVAPLAPDVKKRAARKTSSKTQPASKQAGASAKGAKQTTPPANKSSKADSGDAAVAAEPPAS